VRGILTKVPGVEKVEIDFDNKTAKVTVPESVDAEALAKAVGGRFSATVKS
jgi:copper chaperone CopZ